MAAASAAAVAAARATVAAANAVWELPEAAREAYRASLDINDVVWARARGWALALAVNGIAEYWATFPSLALEGLNCVAAIVRDAT